MTDTTDCVPEGINISAWLLSPQKTNDLVELYNLTNWALKERRPVRELREVYRRYARYLEFTNILDPSFVQDSTQAIKKLRAGLVKALLFRINCCALRSISGIEDCTQNCCCSCVGAPKNVACIKQVMRTFSPDLSDSLLSQFIHGVIS